MPKMTEKRMKEYFLERSSLADRLREDPAFAKEYLEAHLRNVPKGKLYKYRECSNRNLKILEENCIWMAPATSFMDLFDCTVNIDPKQNAPQIKKWMSTRLPELIYWTISSLLEKNGVLMPLSREDFVLGSQKCIKKDGTMDIGQYYQFLLERDLVNDQADFDAMMTFVNRICATFPFDEEEIAETLSNAIDKERTLARERMLVYSTADSFDIDGLWENYAKQYSGFCIGYSFSGSMDMSIEAVPFLSTLMPVIYRKQRPILDLVPMLDGAMQSQINPEDSDAWKLPIMVDTCMQVYYKRDTYSFEHEWRFVAENTVQNKQFFPFIHAIYAGKDIKPRNLQRLCNIAKKLNVPVYQQTPNKAKNGYDYILIKEEKA